MPFNDFWLDPQNPVTGGLNWNAIIEQWAMACCLSWNNRVSAEALADTTDPFTLDVWQFEVIQNTPAWCMWHQGLSVFILIDGTTIPNQVLGEIQGALMTMNATDAAAHSFFAAQAAAIMQQVAPFLPRPGPRVKLHFCGFSLGAAIALIAALGTVTRYGNSSVQYMGFGGPKGFAGSPVGARPIPCITLENTADPVCFLPFYHNTWITGWFPNWIDLTGVNAPWRHLGAVYALDRTGVPAVDLSTFDNWPGPGDIFTGLTNAHGYGQYTTLVVGGYNAAGTDGSRNGVRDIALTVSTSGPNPEQPIVNFNSLAGVTWIDVSSTQFDGELELPPTPPVPPPPGNPPQPNTPLTVNDVVFISGLATWANATLPANIQKEGENVAITATYYGLRMFINCGPYGRSETHYLPAGNRTPAQVYTLAQQVAQARANLLGRETAGAASNGSLGTPGIVAWRLFDAQVLRNSQLVIAAPNPLGGFTINQGNGPSDAWTSALAVRLQGVLGARTAFSNLLIQGQPDDVIKGMTYQGAAFPLNNTTWHQLLYDYLNLLVTSGFGFMGLSNSEPQYTIQSFVVNSGIWLATLSVPTENPLYLDGDTVQITGTGHRLFNRQFKVTPITNNSFNLNNGPPTSITPPAGGKVRRIRTVAGTPPVTTRLVSFYPYQPLGPANQLAVKVSKHNPSRAFDLVSFKRRSRLPA